jgi:predicted nucleic acid-binding protein
MYYFDTSALVKRYLNETGSDRVAEMFSEGQEIFTSSISYAEIYATFSRLRQEGLLSEKDFQQLQFAFESDWQKFAVIEFNSQVRSRIPKIISKVRLRGADLIHFVSLMFALDAELNLKFICNDKKLINACIDLDLAFEEVK